MRTATEILKGVIQSEKAARISNKDQYVVKVKQDANKVEIRRAVEQLFGVKVLRVNTVISHGKWRRLSTRWGRRSDEKKAFVTLAKGQKIEVKTS
ncbi:MAG: 50S ribosomal protein L23 [Candidatus Omnitrophica bacterium]|nr:50S ribosomal protein L23 [Candidatus Omnitrophota bacterium]MBI2174059.1 50S ribosomal protein L23 [Candidatus Omnitrophota bacterium]MBI3010672.1 50S ribosomal protein L23 [Candidatus Omnitrophota bacterium]